MKKFIVFSALLLLIVVAAVHGRNVKGEKKKVVPEGWVDDKPEQEQAVVERQQLVARSGNCPNGCSGHGRCESDGECLCVSGWTGADCSVTDTVLRNGVPVTATVGRRQWQYYHFVVTTSNSALEFSVSQASSQQDCDLYVKQGDYPSRFDYTVRDISVDQSFSVSVEQPATGTWFAGVYGFTDCQYTLTVRQESACPNDCSRHGVCESNGQCTCMSGFVGDDCSTAVVALSANARVPGSAESKKFVYYSFDVAADESEVMWVVNTTSSSGDCDLYVKLAELPTLWDYDFREDSLRRDFNIEMAEPTPGRYFAGVYGFSACQYFIEARVGSSHQCANECSGDSHGVCSGGQCSCRAGYSGEYCERATNALTNGATVSGHVDDDTWNYYTVNSFTSSNLQLHVVQTSEGGDCDLYARAGADPTRFQFDARDVSVRSDFTLTIQAPGDESWHLGIYGYHACSYQLTLQIDNQCPNDCSGHGHCNPNGQCVCADNYSGEDCSQSLSTLVSNRPVTGHVSSADAWHYYQVTNIESGVFVHLAEQQSVGNLWLFASANGFPTLDAHDWQSTATNTAYHNIALARSSDDMPSTLFVGVYANPYSPDCDTQHPDQCLVNYEITAFTTPF